MASVLHLPSGNRFLETVLRRKEEEEEERVRVFDTDFTLYCL